jgi:hypothetical protein
MRILRNRVWEKILDALSCHTPQEDLYKNKKLVIEIFGEAGFHVFFDFDRRTPYVYFIGYFQPRFEPTRLPKWIEEYHYQNSADKPKEITRRAWDARRDNWDRVALRVDLWERRLICPILDDYRLYLAHCEIVGRRSKSKV